MRDVSPHPGGNPDGSEERRCKGEVATTRAITRRNFLRGSLVAGGGFLLGVTGGSGLRTVIAADSDLPFMPHAFLHIPVDGPITFLAKHDEMGQGIHTGLAIALGEELEVDATDMRVVCAPSDRAFAHSVWGMQGTGGSTSTWTSFKQMRTIGAQFRETFVTAAAKAWQVDAGTCQAVNGHIQTKDGKHRASYGELASVASKTKLVEDVQLKPTSAFTRIGKPTPRVDSGAKVRGDAAFSYDRYVPGMLTAMVVRCPYFGGTLEGFDAKRTGAVEGVHMVVRVPSGVAIIADGYWAAMRGRDVLETTWKPGAVKLDSNELRTQFDALSKEPGTVARKDGEADKALGAAEKVLEAVYEVPYQAHAPMEPLSCLVSLRDDGGADLITGSQLLGGDHFAVARRLGVPPEKVTFRNSYLGGGFGRRANPASDFVVEALEVALAGRSLKRPIKTVWTREDDLKGGWYRPLFINRIKAGLADGKISAWDHHIVGQSIATGTAFEGAMVRNGIDQTSIEGAADMPHGIPNLTVRLTSPKLPITVQWWRSVGHSNTAFAKESFLDECAEALKRDPYELRLELLAKHPRWVRVLKLAAEKAGWGSELPAGHGRGIAVHESFKGFAAHVVEASIENGKARVHRVVCAIDCGLVINPDQVVAQMQGAAVFALSSTLSHEISFRDGLVEQNNFNDFQLMRMHEAPKIEVHIVKSDEAMGGIGEVGVPSVASATCSALRAAGGPRIRRLPVGDQLRG